MGNKYVFTKNETKDLMQERDRTKALFKSTDDPVSMSEYWTQFKKFRNHINNKKGNDEYKYKLKILWGNILTSPRTWSTIKRSMDWKTSWTPSELNAMVELSEDPWILQTL